MRKHLSTALTEAEKKNAGVSFCSNPSWSKMARENEMQEFTRSFFGGRPDLSTLTHSIVRQRFLSHTGRDHLDPEEKQALKQLVEEELLKMQVDEAGARDEGLDLAKEARRLPTHCKEPERKRFRLNSESEPSTATSSPDCISPPAKNGMAAIVSPKQASKSVESSDGEEQQRDLTAKIGLEKEVMKESCKEEEENSARTNKVWKEESSEEEDGEKDSKGRARKKPGTRDRTQRKGDKRQSGSSEEDGKDRWRKLRPATKRTRKSAQVPSGKTASGEASDSETEVSDIEAEGIPKGKRKNRSYRKSSKRSRTWSSSSSSNGSPELKGGRVRVGWKTTIKNKQAPGEISASRKQAMEENNSEEEPTQGTGNTGAKSHQESEKESEEEEETLAKKENREEEEDWKARALGNRGEKSAWEERSSKQKSRAARVLGNSREREEEKEKAAADRGDNSGGDEELLMQRKSKGRTQGKGGKRQSGSSEEDGEDRWRKLRPASKSTGKSAKVESGKTANGEASDSEREVSDSEAGVTLEEERKNHSYKKSSKKCRTQSSSSSSNGSPQPKGRKAGHHGEDHPAVMRLKRYIRACGAHRNYKKLLGSCRSHKERLCILRAELEALGIKGNPSLEKCRALKEQREEAAEVASLDITNIISCSGRPRRRTAWNPSEAATPGELYRRALDSEEERRRPPRPDWSHMRGIISSDGESN